MEQASPVEVIVLDEVSNIEGVIMSLKSGLKIPSYAHGKIIFAAKNDTGFEGVLCDTGESLLRQRNPELVALRDDIYTLPYYKHRLTRAHREKQLKMSCQALHNAPPNRT